MRSIHGLVDRFNDEQALIRRNLNLDVHYLDSNGYEVYRHTIETKDRSISHADIAESLILGVRLDKIYQDVAGKVHSARCPGLDKNYTRTDIDDGVADLLSSARRFLNHSTGRHHNLQATQQMNGLERHVGGIFPDILEKFYTSQKNLHGPIPR